MPDELILTIACGACGQRMRVPGSSMGKACKCANCGSEMVVSDEIVQSLQDPSAEAAASSPKPGPRVKPGRIGELLIAGGLVNDEQLQEALAFQKENGGKTFELLIELGHLDKDELHTYLSQQKGVASIDLSLYDINEDLVKLIPQEIARENLVLPIDKMGKLFTVGMACPLDTDTVAKVQEITGLRVKAMLCKLDDILAAVNRYYKADGEEAPAHDFSFVTGAAGKKSDLRPELEKLDVLPAGPEAIAKIQDVVKNPQCVLRDLV